MPAAVQNAAPSTVFPQSLSRAFAHTRQFPVHVNEYANGESQRGRQAETSRKSWRLAKRLAPAQLQQLRAFFTARKGPQEAFYFYDPFETVPRFSHDPTGQSPVGRYTVRFDGVWNESVGLGRADVEIHLKEIA